MLRAGPLRIRPLNAELVALRVGQHSPAGAVEVALVVDQTGADAQQSLDLFVARGIRRAHIEMQPVLDDFALGHTLEVQRCSLVHRMLQPGLLVARQVRVIGVFLVAGDLAPECGERRRRRTVESDLVDRYGHDSTLPPEPLAVDP